MMKKDELIVMNDDDDDDDENSRVNNSNYEDILSNLRSVETSLQRVLEEHRQGQYGFITREWGFTTPGGLGGPLGGKFRPWEAKLHKVKDYFWPVEAYESLEEKPSHAMKNDETANNDHPWPKEAEQLPGNTPLHEFLWQPPVVDNDNDDNTPVEVVLDDADLQDYRTAARIFLLLATISHLCGNSAPDPNTAHLPAWIEDPLLQVAERLQVEPTLTGHFVVQENWVWKKCVDHATNGHEDDSNNSNSNSNHNSATTRKQQRRLRAKAQLEHDRHIATVLLRGCDIEDRRYRLKVFPDCFIGSQAIDLLTSSTNLAETREEAVLLGRRINQKFGLFQHVTGDHTLMDAHLFYRFRKQWRDVMSTPSPSSSMVGGTTQEEDPLHQLLLQKEEEARKALRKEKEARKALQKEKKARKALQKKEEVPTAVGGGGDGDDDGINQVSSKKRDSRQKNKEDTQQDWCDLVRSQAMRRDRLEPATTLPWEHETDKEEDEAYNSMDKDDMEDSRSRSRIIRPRDIFTKIPSAGRGQLERGTSLLSTTSAGGKADNNEVEGTTSFMENAAYFDLSPTMEQETQEPPPLLFSPPVNAIATNCNAADDDELPTTLAAMRMVSVKDRRLYFRTYCQCFIGSQLVDMLLARECARSRPEALRLAKDVNQRFGIFEHVRGNQEIKDKHLFYRFTETFAQMVGSNQEQKRPIKGPIAQIKGQSNSSANKQVRLFDENQNSKDTYIPGYAASSASLYDDLYGFDEPEEFRFENIDMLYPAFQNNHEAVNQLIPALMGYSLRGLPYLIVDILSTMRDLLELEQMAHEESSVNSYKYELRRLCDLLDRLAFSISRCKEQFQLMSTEPSKRTFNSKHVSIRQTQPLSNGVLVRREKGGKPLPAKGVTGTQFPYFHLLDWLFGRHQFSQKEAGLVAKISTVDDTFPRPQRDYIRSLSKLHKSATLRGVIDALGRPPQLLASYGHLLESYAGEGGLLQAHCRKLYSYIHNDVQYSTSGTCHMASKDKSVDRASRARARASDNHDFAMMMFMHMRRAAEERWQLRMPPLMTEVKKIVYSTSDSGGFCTVALNIADTGLAYEYGDVVKVLVGNSDKTTFAWMLSFQGSKYFKLQDMKEFQKNTESGWGWTELWEALGWCQYEKGNAKGVPFDLIARYIEQARLVDEAGRTRWVKCPTELGGKGAHNLFAVPPNLARDQILVMEPVSPRIYSVSGLDTDRVFLLISKPLDGARHHGYERMCDPTNEIVHCSFSPATAFIVPPKKANLVCIASGTGISPFVGLADAIGARPGNYTIVHQCKSSDMFLSGSQNWLDFTANNPGAVVYGYISGDSSRRNNPMRFVVRNGTFEETAVLGRNNASAYYFECPIFISRLKEVYKKDGLNLAYCCGGINSAINPFKGVSRKESMDFEYTIECYGVSSTLPKESTACQIGGTIVNLDHVSPVHPGGDQILYQLHGIANEADGHSEPGTSASNFGGCPVRTLSKSNTPDLSIPFWQLHPHAYNLLRCVRAPADADSEAFAAFLERQRLSKSMMISMATKYAEVALSSPNNDSKVVRIASELQALTLRKQIHSSDTQGAKQSAEYLQALLNQVPSQDEDAQRWSKSLDEFQESFKLNE